jgi:hypothetical protein
MARTLAAQLSAVAFDDFSGGLNLRDAPSELAGNEWAAGFNVTADERGAAAARLGVTKLNGASLLPQVAGYLYYSAVADALLAYISADAGNGKLYKSTDGGVTWSAAYATFTTGAAGAIVDFNGRVIVVNTIDGVYSFPSGLGAPTHTAGGTNNMEAVRGATATVWQNKVWVSGDVNNRARVWWCDPGDPTTWTIANSWVDVREVDDQIVTCIGAGQGIDIAGKPTLVVYKRNSAYRIYDSSSGAFNTLHSTGAGAASATSVAAVNGLICSINDRGVWVTDGISVPVLVSDKLAPLFTSTGLNLGATALATWSAGPQRDRVVFNITRAGSSTNNLQLEYHPRFGWFAAHKGQNLGVCAPYTKATRKLIAAAAATGAVYDAESGGTDDGTAIACSWQSRWAPLNRGAEARCRRIRAWGRGTFDLYLKVDYTQGAGDVYSLDYTASNTGFVWGTGAWGTGVWGDNAYEGRLDAALDEVGTHISVALSKSVSSVSSAPALLGDGSAPDVGAFALYSARVDYVPLGGA